MHIFAYTSDILQVSYKSIVLAMHPLVASVENLCPWIRVEHLHASTLRRK